MEGASLEVCKLCNEPMNDLRILSCAHSFCLNCLESSGVSKDSPKCPTCLIDFEMPQGGLKDLKKNEFVDRLNDLKQINNCCVNCDSCKENQAIKYCVECSYNYCSTCLEHHGRIPTSSMHKLLDRQETTIPTADTININKYSTCNEHHESETLVCGSESCKIVLCSRCFTLKHMNHNIMHLSDYFDSTKTKFEEHLNMKKKTLQNVITNFKSSKSTMYDNELKASNLKKEILERGENIKKAVDSIAEILIWEVDEFLKKHKKEADDVMMELKNMETNLIAQVETLKQKINDLNYANVVERSFTTLEKLEKIENISKYCENFNVSFYFDIKTLTKLGDMFGNVIKAKLVKKQLLGSDVQSLAFYKGNVLVCRGKGSMFEIVKFQDAKMGVVNSTLRLDSSITDVDDLFVIDNMLFVSVIFHNSQYSVLKISIESMKLESTATYFNSATGAQKYKARLSKSLLSHVLVNMSNFIYHLTTSGDIMKTIKLQSGVHDAVQVSLKNYVVCYQIEICIIDEEGTNLVRYMTSDIGRKINSPHALTKDRDGNIYVCDSCTMKIFVLDKVNLNLKSSFDIKRSLQKILYDDDKNNLVALCEDKSLLTFAL